MIIENKVASDNFKAYERENDKGHAQYVVNAKRQKAFYVGDQWEKGDLDRLDQVGRPAITQNMILSTINTVIGEQINQAADIIFKPRESGDAHTAETLTKVVAQILDNNQYRDKETMVFTDGLVQDRGYFDIRMDFDDNMRGEVRIKSLDPLDVVLDGDAKEYDPDTWRHVIITRWMSLDDIEVMYGKAKRKKVEHQGTMFGPDSIETQPDTFSEQPYGVERYDQLDTDNIKRVRVIERQYRKLAPVKYFVDPKTGDMRQIPDSWNQKKIKEFQKMAGLDVISKVEKRIRWTATVDHTVLHDDWSPYNCYTVVPYFPYFLRGKPLGMVKNLIGTQETLNKVVSQTLHTINTTANSGWIIEENSIRNHTPDDIEDRGAETGLVLEVAKGAQPPEKIKPNQVPAGLDMFGLRTIQAIKEISGISDSMMGMDSAEVSGVAIKAKQSRGLTQVQVPFDNLRRTREILGKRILELVQEYYTEERIVRVTDYTSQGNPQQDIAVNQAQPDGSILNDLTIGEYDVVISTTPARDNFEETQFAEAISLMEAGIPIPPDAIIEYSNLSKKYELAERVRKEAGLEPDSEQQQMQAMMQQIQLQEMQLNLEKMKAEIQKIGTDSILNQAKAQDLGMQNPEDPQTMMSELQMKYQMNQEDNMASLQETMAKIEADLQIAKDNNATKLEIARSQNAMKRIEADKDRQFNASEKDKDRKQAAKQKPAPVKK